MEGLLAYLSHVVRGGGGGGGAMQFRGGNWDVRVGLGWVDIRLG